MNYCNVCKVDYEGPIHHSLCNIGYLEIAMKKTTC